MSLNNKLALNFILRYMKLIEMNLTKFINQMFAEIKNTKPYVDWLMKLQNWFNFVNSNKIFTKYNSMKQKLV